MDSFKCILKTDWFKQDITEMWSDLDKQYVPLKSKQTINILCKSMLELKLSDKEELNMHRCLRQNELLNTKLNRSNIKLLIANVASYFDSNIEGNLSLSDVEVINTEFGTPIDY